VKTKLNNKERTGTKQAETRAEITPNQLGREKMGNSSNDHNRAWYYRRPNLGKNDILSGLVNLHSLVRSI
jgi:hypothetical protein